MTTSPASDDILERLLTLHPKLVDLSLGRIERLLAALDHPERKLPPAVHVTGTNGKGSVLAFVRAMLEDAGYRVHVYISPHLARFHERIRLAGELISEPDLRDVLEHCERANGHLPITFFEITTAAAFVAFARTPADILLLENGLGGRLDATNVIERPLATAITPVSLDHQNFLGDTLAKIAFEKAGIIKRGVPCVLGPQPDEALKVIRARAGELSAPLIETPGGWTSERTPDGLTVTVGDKVLSLPAPVLAGPHQTANAGQAVALALALQGFELTEKNIAAGLANAQWPARLQRLKSGPVLDAVPADWEVWLDGGHNPSAGDAVSAHARAAWADWRRRRLRRPARHRADDPGNPAGGFPARRISSRARHGRHGGAAPRSPRHAEPHRQHRDEPGPRRRTGAPGGGQGQGTGGGRNPAARRQVRRRQVIPQCVPRWIP